VDDWEERVELREIGLDAHVLQAVSGLAMDTLELNRKITINLPRSPWKAAEGRKRGVAT
jgi:hypothetical protein